MIANEDGRKQLIDFLIRRWRVITNFAAIERVYAASYKFAKENDMPIPQPPTITIPQACRQIEVLKRRIIEVLPEVKFIDYSYESQAPLDPNDWVEMFVADNNQCITKIQDVVEKMKLT